MTSEEQSAFDDLTTRFNATAGLILELQAEIAKAKHDLSIVTTQRDTYKTGFQSQSRMHAEAAAKLAELVKPGPKMSEPPVGEPASAVAPPEPTPPPA